MAVIRVPKGNFTTVENSIFKDGRISLKAKGLFCYMLSKKDGWSFSAERIATENNDGRDGVRAGLRELEQFGYLSRAKVNDGRGLFVTEYQLNYPDLPTSDGLTSDGKTVVGLSDDGKTNDGLTDVGKAVDNSKEEYSKDYSSNTNSSKENDSNIFTASAEEKNLGDLFSNENPIEPTGKEKSSAKKESEKFGKAEFRQTLLDIGVKKQYVDDWMAVRTAKRAVFTATALQAIFNECITHNLPVADAIKMCAEKSWQGFKYSWYLKELNDGKQTSNTTSQSREQRVNEVAEFRVANQQSLATRLQKYITSDNE